MGEKDEFVIISDVLRNLMSQGDKEVRSLLDVVNRVKIAQYGTTYKKAQDNYWPIW